MPSDYVVFRSASEIDDETDGRGWVEIGRATAATPKAAIKAATDGKPPAERTGTFVATPVRSWRPVTRKVEPAEREVWG